MASPQRYQYKYVCVLCDCVCVTAAAMSRKGAPSSGRFSYACIFSTCVRPGVGGSLLQTVRAETGKRAGLATLAYSLLWKKSAEGVRPASGSPARSSRFSPESRGHRVRSSRDIGLHAGPWLQEVADSVLQDPTPGELVKTGSLHVRLSATLL